MKILLTVYLLFLFLPGKGQPCPEGINLLPMYGDVQKCKEQLEADQRFFEFCDQSYTSRKEASKAHIQMAWDHAYKGDAETAMKRFNQAWLLDTLNADAYWGFGILIGKDGKFDESIALFNKSLELNPVNSDVWYCLAVSYQGLYHKDPEDKHKEEMLKCLHKAIEINPNNYNAIRTLQQETKSEGNEVIIQSNPSR